MDTETSPSAQAEDLQNKVDRLPASAYPLLRRTFFWLVFLFFFIIAVFLIYQNGKSIYDNGI